MKIPKIFHRVWLGNKPMPEEFVRYGKTWEKHNPDWKMILWTEETLPPMINEKYLKECNTYSEMSDIIRYEVLYRYGGIYIDTDFECLKPIEELIKDYDVFASTEDNKHICGGFFGSTRKHPLVKKMIDNIPPALERNKRQTSDLRIGPKYVTQTLQNENITIIDKEFIYPYLPGQIKLKKELSQNKVAYAAHHWAASWMGEETKKKKYIQAFKNLDEFGAIMEDVFGETPTRDKPKRTKVIKQGVSIVIPYKEDKYDPEGIRKDNFNFVVNRYKEIFPRAEIVLGEDTKGDDIHFCRATAINNGVEKCKYNTIIISDADLIIKENSLEKAIKEVEQRGFIIPWGRCYDITKEFSEEIKKTGVITWQKARKDELRSIRDIRQDKMAGGIQVILKTVFNRVGGYDEEFYGWGYEDTDFCRRIIEHLGSYPIYKGGEIIHLWHPRSYPNIKANRDLYNKKHPEHAK